MYGKEEVYDEEIAPVSQKILEICKREELPMVAQFYLAEETPYSGCSTIILFVSNCSGRT